MLTTDNILDLMPSYHQELYELDGMSFFHEELTTRDGTITKRDGYILEEKLPTGQVVYVRKVINETTERVKKSE